MSWPAFQHIARVRAIEESDAEGTVWDGDVRRAVTQEAGRGNPDTATFLYRRALRLQDQGRASILSSWLKVPRLPGWLPGLGWVAAFILGWWLAALGQEGEINLLALPLVGILAWNVIVILLSLWPSSRKVKEVGADDDWRENLLKRFERKSASLASLDLLTIAARERFRGLVKSAALHRFGYRFRAWLHLGAALLALGSVGGMYARGWAKEYRAVWESTLLDESGATKFFQTLFAPAAAVTGHRVPLEEIRGMHRRVNQEAEKPGDALPWIHLYAATLGLFVLLPRFLLVAVETSRARSIPLRVLRGQDWQTYAQRLRSLVEGAGAPAQVLTHGLAQDAASLDRWRHWAFLHWRDVGQLTFATVPVGGESEFVHGWSPHGGRVMLVFNMGATPEAEIQRALVEGLAKKLNEGKDATGALLLVLDDTDLRKRLAGFGDLSARLAERSAAWNEAMNGSGAIWHELVMPGKRGK